MIGGTYKIELHTTMGKKSGCLEIRIDNENIGGALFIMDKENTIDKGCIKGNHCILKGQMSTLMSNVHYTLDCVIEGGMLEGIVKTTKGDMRITGIKKLPKQPERTDK